jgi:hypothetical protein
VAVNLYREGLLPDDAYEQWAIRPQAEFREEYRSMLEELAALLESRGEIAAQRASWIS